MDKWIQDSTSSAKENPGINVWMTFLEFMDDVDHWILIIGHTKEELKLQMIEINIGQSKIRQINNSKPNKTLTLFAM